MLIEKQMLSQTPAPFLILLPIALYAAELSREKAPLSMYPNLSRNAREPQAGTNTV
jgi:hypothetical protein